ncbi:hypothetical protein ACEPAF_3091 [Sanghuangporus sanghuang]
MPAFHKTTSKQSILPYIRSASSKLSLCALSSTSSISALFSSSASMSGSSKSIFMSGIRGIMNAQQDKENTLPSESPSNSTLLKKAKSRKDRSKKGSAYPEISAPQMTSESLEAVRAKFTLVPLKKTDPREEEMDMVVVSQVDYQDMPASQQNGRRF